MLSTRAFLKGLIASYCAVVVAGVIILVDSTLGARGPGPGPVMRPSAPGKGLELGVVKRLTDRVSLYPRAVRLAHSGSYNGRIIVSVVSHDGREGTGEIFESADGGATFAHLATIADPRAAGGRGLCCGTLFEVPRRTGRTAEGTLLWAASVGQSARPRAMALRVWRSDDHGRTWTYLSSCATTRSSRGLWEPELSVDSTGRLVCHFSDETQRGHSQVLARVYSTDGGYSWRGKANTVVGRSSADRPGMAVVRELPYGVYVMSYEVCSTPGSLRCAVHVRTSSDGWKWNGPDYVPESVRQAHFEHAPTIAWAPGPGMFGRLFLIGQVLVLGSGEVASPSGDVLLTNDQRGGGTWSETSAPLDTPVPARDACSNYSSALLPSADGDSLLEIGTRYDTDGVCRAYFATAGLR
ncbi:glycoside hydrolase [Actinoallomurus spadix]|uniref:Sialidase family protein n=1 Tax=Actinoallomurus spadix TaxID=79912 RepID=A0ABP3FJF0_9ACTN|nr:sialidase family protein [Actinoallomurus spadix]MCO5985780.1 glycoside hydrolase [Actinoallomurus spadix]